MNLRSLLSLYTKKYSWLIILLVTIFQNEWNCYFWSRLSWPATNITSSDGEVVTFLIVADPQIQGMRDESHTVGFITRWDADRYLSKGFSWALSYTQPDAILFLGDLIDEGSKATEAEYASYYTRFQSIFFNNVNLPSIVIPGDNDVGGEGADLKTDEKKTRYTARFGEMVGVTSVKFVDVVKLDMSRGTLVSKSDKDKINKLASRSDKKLFTLVINHENLFTGYRQFHADMMKQLEPHLILSAHRHQSFVFGCDKCWEREGRTMPVYDVSSSLLQTFSLHLAKKEAFGKERVLEFGVPTCSYRMGEMNAAYGVLQINSNGDALYRNLWLPHRFFALFLYVVALILALGSACCWLRMRRSSGDLYGQLPRNKPKQFEA